jgi:pyruvate dehydrogenase E2 component (dihydrolipoamide acetyltransferase)
MAVEFAMPKLGLTMEAGTILEWLVESGSEVAAGDAVLVIETDKVESEVEANAAGRLHITGEKGQSYDCGVRIGWFLADGEDAPSETTPVERSGSDPSSNSAPAATVTRPVDAAPTGGRLLASPNAKRVAAERGIDLQGVVGTGPGGRITSEDVPLTAPVAAAGNWPATIAARQLAELLGVDLASVAAGGPEGRVSREDVARHVRGRLAAEPAAAASSAPSLLPALQPPTEVVPLAGMRGTIASRMHESLQQMAQLTLTMDAVMDAVIADRSARTDKPGYTDYVIAAAAGALRDHPVVNSQITADGVALLPEIHVGMAVALDGGLVVPVVTNTDERSIEEVSTETTRLASAARDGKLGLSDLEGGTFSVTALGMYGVDAFTPVINPPNTAILGVGRLRDEVRVVDGDVTSIKVLTLSLTWDHRAFDGAPAAEFAASVRARLEGWGSTA